MEQAVAAFKSCLVGLTPYQQVGPGAKRERRKILEELLKVLMVDERVQLKVLETGDLLVVCDKGHVGEERDNREHAEAMRVWKRSRRLALSVRSTYALPLTCSRQQLDITRALLTPYKAKTYSVTAASMSQRSAAVTDLSRVVREQVLLAKECDALVLHNPEVWVIICPDATPLWNTSATKCDVFVHLWGGVEGGIEAAGNPARWAIWWALDGPDDAPCLRAIDVTCGLHEQIVALEQEDIIINGIRARIRCFLTGDGKAMRAMNHGDGDKQSCPCCNDPHSLQPSDMVMDVVRWGAFLRCIPVYRRVGDFVHGQCRVANAFWKRLRAMVATWAVGVPGSRAGLQALHQIFVDLKNEAQAIPPSERLAPRRTKEGTLDISTARLFWDASHFHQRCVLVLKEHFGGFKVGGLYVHALINVLLSSFSAMHTLWRKKVPLTNEEVQRCKGYAQKVGWCWGKLGWSVTPWVHWVVAHSGVFYSEISVLVHFFLNSLRATEPTI